MLVFVLPFFEFQAFSGRFFFFQAQITKKPRSWLPAAVVQTKLKAAGSLQPLRPTHMHMFTSAHDPKHNVINFFAFTLTHTCN